MSNPIPCVKKISLQLSITKRKSWKHLQRTVQNGCRRFCPVQRQKSYGRMADLYKRRWSRSHIYNERHSNFSKCHLAKFLENIYRDLFAERVDRLSDEKLMKTINSTSCKMGMKPRIAPNDCFLFSTRRKEKPIYTVGISDTRNVIKSVLTFNYYYVYHNLKNNGKVDMIGGKPHPYWKW